jgi:hypothetical protein
MCLIPHLINPFLLISAFILHSTNILSPHRTFILYFVPLTPINNKNENTMLYVTSHLVYGLNFLQEHIARRLHFPTWPLQTSS